MSLPHEIDTEAVNAQPESPVLEKAEIETIEQQQHRDVDAQIEDLKAGQHVQLKSQLDRLTILQSVKTFKWAILICAGAAFTAATDGR